jgi:hypothetical protein
MNKYSVGFSIKLPIPGQQYSNLEARFNWEEETELPFDKAMEHAEGQIEVMREKVDRVGGELQLAYKSLIELQEEKLAKAREEFIKLKNQ